MKKFWKWTLVALLALFVVASLTLVACKSDGIYAATFVADGQVVETVIFREDDFTFNEPTVPQKEHYTAAWEDYSVDNKNIVVHAIYTPIEYAVTFDDGTNQTVVHYTVENIYQLDIPQVTTKPHYDGYWEHWQPAFTDEQVIHAVYSPTVYTLLFVGYNQYETVSYTWDTKDEIEIPTVRPREHYSATWQEYELQFEQNQVVNAVYTPIEYKITFVGNGQRIERKYTIETYWVERPNVPNKPHYTGEWQPYELLYEEDQIVNAIYTPIEYRVTFAGCYNQRYERTYTEETKTDLDVPAVPKREHYEGAWQSYELQFDNDQVVNAVYTPIEYTATFDDGTKQTTVNYTIENFNSVSIPQVTPKQYYDGKWQGQLDFTNEQVILADYIPIEYKVTFVGNGQREERTYTVETKNELTAPQVPAKEHYTAAWQDYELKFDNDQVVNAVYTPIEYKITFVGNGQRIERTYTAETTTEFTAPQVPAKEKYFGFDYVGTWEQFYFQFDDNQEVNAAYTLDTPGYTYTLNEDKHSYSLTNVAADIEEAIVLPFYNDLPVTSIGAEALWCSAALQMVTFEGNSQLNSIGSYAFHLCPNLQNVYYGGTIENWCEIVFGDYNANPMCYADNFFMKQGTDWQAVTEIEIPEGVEKIGDYQFYGFNNILSFTFLENITSIGNLAFEGCSNLTKITIPSTVTKIGVGAFRECWLKEVTFADNIHLTEVGEGAFNISNLKNVYYGGTIEGWCGITFGDENANPMYHADNFFMKQGADWQEVTEIEIQEGVEKIGNDQFNGFSNVTSIIISSTVKSIGEDAFDFYRHGNYNNHKLQNVYYGGTIESWCRIMFDGAYANPMSYAPHFFMREGDDWQEVTEIVVPESVEKIGDYQFYGFGNVTSVTILGSITGIGDYAFYECSQLTSIIIPRTVTNIGQNAFHYCSNLTIYCEAESEPIGWHTRWNPSNCPVVWDYKNQ